MDAAGITYFIVGFVVAVIYYHKESKKATEIDEPIANVTTMFVWALWPVVFVIWLIKWIYKKLISLKEKQK
jgi:uncharacterized membrane protein